MRAAQEETVESISMPSASSQTTFHSTARSDEVLLTTFAWKV